MRKYYSEKAKEYYIGQYHQYRGSVTNFCEINGLKLTTFRKWLAASRIEKERKPFIELQEKDKSSSTPLNLIQYNLSDSQKIELQLSNGCKLLFPESISNEKLISICNLINSGVC